MSEEPMIVAEYFIPKAMLDAFLSEADKADSKPDALLDRWLDALDDGQLLELAARPRRKGGDKRVVELTLRQATRSRLTKAAVETDASNSHVVQHVLASRLPNFDGPQ